MIRLFFSFFLTVVVARWIYAETKMVVPGAVPVIDFALDKVQIPTHDKWDSKSKELTSMVNDLSSLASSLVQPAEAAELDRGTLRSYGRPVAMARRTFGRGMCRSGACETF